MSWSDFFPLMDDDMVALYQRDSSPQEKLELQKHFAIQEIHNQRKVDHVVATSLFWKPANVGESPYPVPTRELMQNPEGLGLASRFKNPWSHYVAPVFEAVRHLSKIRPDLVYRVYLANDLSFLIPELVEAGCEVYLMESSSVAHNPGAMWRFLAMEEDGLVTMSDSDRAAEMIHDIERTELVAEGGLCFWRCPYFWDTAEGMDLGNPGGYHTTAAGLMGTARPLPIRLLCEAFIWGRLRGLIPGHVKVGTRTVPIVGAIWPDFGFDEFFLNAAIYPRAAFEGMLTFVHWKAAHLNHWLALDIEYVTWANPKSEIMFWGDPEKDSGSERLFSSANHGIAN